MDTQSDDEITSDNEMIADLLTKITAFVEKIKEDKFEKDLLIDEWQILNDFFNLVDKKITDEDSSIAERGLNRFFTAVDKIPSYNLLSTDLTYLKTIFYMFFDLFNFTTVQNYLKNIEMSDHLKLLCRTCITKILAHMYGTCISSKLGFNDDERPMNYIGLLSLLINYVKVDLESSDLSIQPADTDTRSSILQFILNYSDKTVLIPDLIGARCLEIITEGLSMINKTANVHVDLKKQLIAIIYNISRHDDGIKQLNPLNAAEQIKVFQNNNNDPFLDIVCSMAWVLVSTSEQIQDDRERMNNVSEKLLQTMYYIPITTWRTDDGLHISEVLVVVAKLSNDDRSLDYIIEHAQVDLYRSRTVHFFANILGIYHSMVGDEDPSRRVTCAALVNILWRISFQDKYKEILKNSTTNFQELIQNFTKEPDENVASNHYVPKYIETIQKAAQGLVYNIDWSFHPASKQDIGVTLPSTTTTEETLRPEKSIGQWNKDDISQWFQGSGIRAELQSLCRFENGYELLNYAKMFLDTEKFQYQMYSDEFSRRNGITSGKDPLLLHEFTKFSSALRKLEKLNQ